MNTQIGAANLTKYIVEPIKRKFGKKMTAYLYHDFGKESELSTNNKGVDIISYQLELQFEGNEQLFISWANIGGWYTYSLCVSETSFCESFGSFSKRDKNWTRIIGQELKSFEVYGYKENVVKGGGTIQTFYYEPHLLTLRFGNDDELGIANFYSENDFEPKYAMGDDVWIIFGREHIDSYIKKLSLEYLMI